MVELKMDCPHCKKQFKAQIQEIHSPKEAREMAIAPELLKMLEKAVERCEINNCEGEEDEFIKMFNATIAKARGIK